MVVSIGILALLFLVLTSSMDIAKRFNKLQLVKQQCLAAGQAQLDSIAATGKPIGQENFERLWPKVQVVIDEKPGSGEWEGLKLVSVITKARSLNKSRDVKIELSRYVSIEGGQ